MHPASTVSPTALGARSRRCARRCLLAALALGGALAAAGPARAEQTPVPQDAVCRPSGGEAGRAVDPLALIRWAIETSGLGDAVLDADDDGDTLLEEKQLALVDPFYCRRSEVACNEADAAAQHAIHDRLDDFVREQGGRSYRFERIRRPDPAERNDFAFLAEHYEVVDRAFQLGEVLSVPAEFVRIVCLERPIPPDLIAGPASEPEEDLQLPWNTGLRLTGALDDLGKERAQLRGVRPAEFSIFSDVNDGETTYHVNLFAGYQIGLGTRDRTNFLAIPFFQYEEKFDQSDVDIEKIGGGGLFQATVVSENLGRDEFAISPYFLTDKKASKEILTVRLRATPSLPEETGIPLGYSVELGGLLWRFGLDALVETGNVLGIEDEDSPLETGTFLRTGGRIGVNLEGAEGTLLEQFGLELSHKYLYGSIGSPTHINRFEAELSYRVPGSEHYQLSLSYQDGRVDDTLEDKEFWKTTLGVRF